MNKFETVEYKIVDISKVKLISNYYKNKYLTKYNKNYILKVKNKKDKYVVAIFRKVIE